jgi:ferritin-like metal-binding protein YciE
MFAGYFPHWKRRSRAPTVFQEQVRSPFPASKQMEKGFMNTLQNTFLETLADIYDAEHQLTKALPKMAQAAENESLRAGFETHLSETESHISRLEDVFEIFGEKAKAKKCKAMQGLISEGEELIDDEAGDAALIAVAQKVEHYEIATYGSLKSWAQLLGKREAAGLLEQTLREEKATDTKLTEVAETVVNVEENQEQHARAD